MKEFTKADLKPGMAVKLRDGTCRVLIPYQGGYALYGFSGEAFMTATTTDRLNDDLTHECFQCFDIMKVYDIPYKYSATLDMLSTDARELLWKRPIELKRCPFCRKAKTAVLLNTYDDDKAEFSKWRVVCSVHNGGCGATGGYGDSEEEAIENWNRRAE